MVLIICACALPVTGARAWTWPVDGPVLRPFTFDHAHPYAADQHRGVDLGAPSGSPVLAPAQGIVSFAGTVPTGGKTVSIETPFGYTATLVHLGSIGIVRGARVEEGSVVGTVGPSGVVDLTEPYVYFGTRTTSDPQGYVDPLTLLPSRTASTPPAGVDTAPVGTVGSTGSVESAATAPVSGAAPGVDAGANPVPAAVTSVASSAATESTSAASSARAAQTAAPAVGRTATDVAQTVGTAPPKPGTGRAPHLLPLAAAPSAPAIASHKSTLIRAEAEPPLPESVIADSSQAEHASPDLHGDSRTVSAGGTRQHVGTSGWQLLSAVLLVALAVAAGVPLALRWRSTRKAARIMVLPRPEHVPGREPAATEDLGGPGLAVRRREEASGPRGRLRSARGYLRAVPEVEGQRRPDGQWDGRARYAGDGHGGPRRRLAA